MKSELPTSPPQGNSNIRLLVLTSGALLLGLALGVASATMFSHSHVASPPAPNGTAWSAEHAAIPARETQESAPTF